MAYEIKNTNGLHSNRVKMIVFAQSGFGKSTALGTLEGSTLILSSEAGLLVLDDKDIDTIEVTDTDTLGEIYVDIKEGKLDYDNVCLDSLTEIGEIVVNELEQDEYYGDPSNTFKLWGQYTKKMTKIVKLFRDLPNCNVVITALAEPTEVNGGIVYLPQVPAKKFQSKLVSLFDEVYYGSVGKDGDRFLNTTSGSSFQAKSRAGIFDKQIDITDNKESTLGAMLKAIANKNDNKTTTEEK